MPVVFPQKPRNNEERNNPVFEIETRRAGSWKRGQMQLLSPLLIALQDSVTSLAPGEASRTKTTHGKGKLTVCKKAAQKKLP